MRLKMRRFTSALLAFTLAALGMFSYFPSYAEEENWDVVAGGDAEEAEFIYEEEPAEPQKYSLTLPYNEAIGYTYDENKFDHQDEENKDIILMYEPDEKAEIILQIAEGMELSEISLVDEKQNPVEFTWEEAEMKVSFAMPAKNLRLKCTLNAVEAEDSTVEEIDVNEPAAEEAEEISAEVEEEIDQTVEDDYPVEETVEESPIEPEIDDDGLPAQGSVETVEAITIPYDFWDFSPENDFTNIGYDTDAYTTSYVSDDIVYDEPGTYSSIYHVTDNESGKFWYVLRPVIVSEEVADNVDVGIEDEEVEEALVSFYVGEGGVVEYEKDGETITLTSESMDEEGTYTETFPVGEEINLLANAYEGYLLDFVEALNEDGELIGYHAGQDDDEYGTEFSLELKSEDPINVISSFKYLDMQVETEEEETEEESETETETESNDHTVIFRTDGPGIMNVFPEDNLYELIDSDDPYETVLDLDEIDHDVFYIWAVVEGTGEYIGYNADDGLDVTVTNYETGLGGYVKMAVDLSEAEGGEVLTAYFDEYDASRYGIQNYGIQTYASDYDFDTTTKAIYTPSHYEWYGNANGHTMYESHPVYGDCSIWGNGGWLMSRPDADWLYTNLTNGKSVPDDLTWTSVGMTSGYVFMRCNGTSHSSSYGWDGLSNGQAYVRCYDMSTQGKGTNEKNQYTFIAWYLDNPFSEGQTTEGYFQFQGSTSGEASVVFRKTIRHGSAIPDFSESDAETGNSTIELALSNAEKGRDILGNQSSLMGSVDNEDDDNIDELEADVREGTTIKVYEVNEAGIQWIEKNYPGVYDETKDTKASTYNDLTAAVYAMVQDVWTQGETALKNDPDGRFSTMETLTVGTSGKTSTFYFTPDSDVKEDYADIFVYQETKTNEAVNMGWNTYSKRPSGAGYAGGVFFAAKEDKSADEYTTYVRVFGNQISGVHTLDDITALSDLEAVEDQIRIHNQLRIYSAPITKELVDQTGNEITPADVGLTWEDFSWQISTTSDFDPDYTISVPFSTSDSNSPTNTTTIFGLFPCMSYYVREDPNCNAVKSGVVKVSDDSLPYISFALNEEGDITYSDKYYTDVTSRHASTAATKHDAVGVSDSGKYQFINEVQRGYFQLTKTSTNTSVTDGNSMYSLSGAEFSIVDKDGNTPNMVDIDGNKITKLVTDENGNIGPIGVLIGTYTVTETKAPSGYKLNSDPITVTVGATNQKGSPAKSSIEDIPVTFIPDVFLAKTATHNTTMSLAGAQFEAKFYAGASSANGTPTKTWILESDEENYEVLLDERHKISGDSFYVEDGNVVLPLGYLTIQEIEPPTGYLLSDEMITYTITQDGNEAKAVISGSTTVEHEPVMADEPKFGGISLDKRDIETEDGMPQGDATLEGAVYSIINMNDYTVSLKSDPDATFAPGEEVMQLITDENGHAESGIELQYGAYKIVEVDPPTGYTPEGENLVYEFFIENDGEVIEYTVKNRVIRFDIQLIKFRDTLSSEEPTDDVEPIEGVTFGIYLKRTDELILTITTDEEGVATTADPENYPYGRLPYGTYVIRELEYPEDVSPVEDFEVFGEIDGKTYAGIYKNDHPIESGITVAKTDAESGKTIPLAGTEFQILDENGEVMTFNNYYPHYEEITNFVTDASGSITLPQKLAYGTYYLHEVNAPYGYLLADDIEFEITEYNSWPDTVTVELPDYPEKGQIVVNKYDAETKETLAGAVFAVFADEDIRTADGTIHAVKNQYMETFVIDEDGVGKSSELYLGSYYIQEIQAPSGYCLDDTRIEVTLEYENQETPVTYVYDDIYNKPTSVIIRKVDEEGSLLEGVKFNITPILVEEEPETESETEIETEIDSELAQEEETSTESETASNDEEEESSGILNSIKNFFSAITVKAEETEREIINENDSDNEAEDYVTDADGIITKRYLKPGIYMIEEKEALEHYILDDEVRYVTVDRNGFIYESDAEGQALDEDKAKSDVVTLEWVNSTSAVPVEISKKDVTGEDELPGANLTITDEEGNVIDEWTSSKEPHKVELFEGTYTLTETLAPDGYATAESVTFTIDNENIVHEVTMHDSPLVLEVSKKDITDNEELPGAHLIIEDENGSIIDEWTSTNESHVIEKIPAGKYKLIETTAPDGYEVAETIEFTVTDTAEIQHVEMFDSPTPTVEVSKKDITDNEELPGAELTIVDENGDVVDEWISKDEPHEVQLSPGTYTLIEETAPDGYATAESVEFTVTDTTEVQHVEMFDSPTQVEISKKDITDDEELPGAHLTVKDEEGNVVDDWTSTNEPHMITNLPAGDYTLTEVTAPNGYEVAETVEFTVEDTCDIQHVTMYDSPKESTVDLTGKTTTNSTPGSTSSGSTPSSSTPASDNVTAGSVKTGDIFRYGAAILVIVGGAVLLVVSRKKKKQA